MSIWSNNPKGKAFIDEVVQTFLGSPIAHRPDRKIIFVCGGPIRDHNKTSQKNNKFHFPTILRRPPHSARDGFFQFARENINQYRFFLAETATTAIKDQSQEPIFINLSDFESLVADIADCILIFPESPGSWAELGLFSAGRKIRRKILIVNDIRYQEESFINNGPIDAIENDTPFKPKIILDLQRRPNFNVIKNRLLEKLRHTNSKKIIFQNNRYPGHAVALSLIFELVKIFRISDQQTITLVSQKIAGTRIKKHVDSFLGILVGAGYISMVERNDMVLFSAFDVPPFFEFTKVKHADLIARATYVILEMDPELIRLVQS